MTITNNASTNPYMGQFKGVNDTFSDQTMQVVHERYHDLLMEGTVPADDSSEEFEEWLDDQLSRATVAYLAELFPTNAVVTYNRGVGYMITFGS